MYSSRCVRPGGRAHVVRHPEPAVVGQLRWLHRPPRWHAGLDDVGPTATSAISVTDGSTFSFARARSASRCTSAPNGARRSPGAPPTAVVAGQPYSFTPSASDPDGEPLTFSVASKPAWASFDVRHGRLSRHAIEQRRSEPYRGHRDQRDRWHVHGALAPFSIAVDSRAQPHTRRSQAHPASTVVAGQTVFVHAARATDADGDALTFSIQNQPVWATFSSSTGRLSGTPTSSQVGTYGNIVISVSDGTASRALAAFGIDVTAAPNRAPDRSAAHRRRRSSRARRTPSRRLQATPTATC